jgi:hypothetical protein
MVRCEALPPPTEPYDSRPGLRLACCTNDLKSATGRSALVTSICGAEASSEIGCRSLSGS